MVRSGSCTTVMITMLANQGPFVERGASGVKRRSSAHTDTPATGGIGLRNGFPGRRPAAPPGKPSPAALTKLTV